MTDLTLRAALEKCRDTFAEYAELHRHKLTARMGSTERNAVHQKIERNRDMADMCIAALEREPDEAMVGRVDAILHQMATFQDGNAQPHTIALINEMADLLQDFVSLRTTDTARIADIEAALRTAKEAIDEYHRYWFGGEMHGSYDGKPERAQLWAAGRAARAALRSNPNDPR